MHELEHPKKVLIDVNKIDDKLKARSLSARALSRKLGMSETWYAKVKKNPRIGLDKAKEMAGHLGCDVMDIISNKEKMVVLGDRDHIEYAKKLFNRELEKRPKVLADMLNYFSELDDCS